MGPGDSKDGDASLCLGLAAREEVPCQDSEELSPAGPLGDNEEASEPLWACLPLRKRGIWIRWVLVSLLAL